MIKVVRRGRFAEWLFQFCFAKTLACRFKYRFEGLPVVGIPKTLKGQEGDYILSPLTHIEGQWPFDAYTGRPLLPEELVNPPYSNLTLQGFFQRYDLFAENTYEIREDWLRPDQILERCGSDEFLVCLHFGVSFTEDETLIQNSCLREDEVRRLVKTVAHGKLHILTDSPKHALIKSLVDLGATIAVENELESLLFIRSFQKIAISQCALHWWGAFLSDAKEIYFPPCNRGIWLHPAPALHVHEPNYHGIDLRVNEPRYIYDW